jgi:hypothetical protein
VTGLISPIGASPVPAGIDVGCGVATVVIGGEDDCPNLRMASSRDRIRVDGPRWYKHRISNGRAAHIVSHQAGRVWG